ncbi:hypothetical protein GCM10027176_46920 [Actinoallomurus bryophytorum]|uniref:pyridoxal-dependent decarboxylase n=1 Tax=Actinoallomurus bryophytorum TaxID=1490222 RepID=UPI001152429E|nr:pyridoxal-dependent decarboxylase [Actinoallomurus bryophytorum]
MLRALRFLGFGERAVVTVACDDQDNVRLDVLEQALGAINGPTIVVVECGNVNTGAFDDFAAGADLIDAHRAAGSPAWVHVDGAVMLLAAASPAMAGQVAGLDRLDSWSTPGRPTGTSSSTPTTAASRSAATRPLIAPR